MIKKLKEVILSRLLWVMVPVLIGLLSMLSTEVIYAAEKPAPIASSVPITVTTAIKQDIEAWQSSEGQLVSITSPMIAAEVSGRIIAISADAGQAVVAGQVLAKIDPVDFKLSKDLVSADIQRLQSLIVAQKLQVKRLLTLVGKKSANQSSLDKAQAQLGALKAQLIGAKVQLQQAERKIFKSQIVSSVNGYVETRKISVGDYVKVATPLFRITRLNRLRVWLPFPESLGSQLRVGLPVKLSSPVAPEHKVLSEITGIRPEITRTSRAINVLVDVANPGGWKPGASITGAVRVGLHKAAVLVPEACIIRRPSGLVVYRIQHGKAQQLAVTKGLREGNNIEILAGVHAGDQLALDGAAYLTDGQSVDVQNTTAAGSAQ